MKSSLSSHMILKGFQQQRILEVLGFDHQNESRQEHGSTRAMLYLNVFPNSPQSQKSDSKPGEAEVRLQ